MKGEQPPLLSALPPGMEGAARRLRPPRTVEARPQPPTGPDGIVLRRRPTAAGRAKVRIRIRVRARRQRKPAAAVSVAPLRRRSHQLPIARFRRLVRAAAIRATRAGRL